MMRRPTTSTTSSILTVATRKRSSCVGIRGPCKSCPRSSNNNNNNNNGNGSVQQKLPQLRIQRRLLSVSSQQQQQPMIIRVSNSIRQHQLVLRKQLFSSSTVLVTPTPTPTSTLAAVVESSSEDLKFINSNVAASTAEHFVYRSDIGQGTATIASTPSISRIDDIRNDSTTIPHALNGNNNYHHNGSSSNIVSSSLQQILLQQEQNNDDSSTSSRSTTIADAENVTTDSNSSSDDTNDVTNDVPINGTAKSNVPIASASSNDWYASLDGSTTNNYDEYDPRHNHQNRTFKKITTTDNSNNRIKPLPQRPKVKNNNNDVDNSTVRNNLKNTTISINNKKSTIQPPKKHALLSKLQRYLIDKDIKSALATFYLILNHNKLVTKQQQQIYQKQLDAGMDTTKKTTTEETALAETADNNNSVDMNNNNNDSSKIENSKMELSNKQSDLLIEIPSGLVKALLFLIAPEHPFDIYRVVQYYMNLETCHENLNLNGNINHFTSYIRLCCDSIRYIKNNFNRLDKTHLLDDSVRLIRATMTMVTKLNSNGQNICIPVLLSSVCEQPSYQLGKEFSYQIYQYMIKEGISVPNSAYWIHILSFSKFHRQDLPFDDILHHLVMDLGIRPDVINTFNVLENFFPFTNYTSTMKVLKSIYHLQKQVSADIQNAQLLLDKAKDDLNKNSNNNTDPNQQEKLQQLEMNLKDIKSKQYHMDLHLIETIGASASSQGQSEICLLLWDIVDILQYKPTVAIYENTVVAFAKNSFTYREAFIVLYEMEQLHGIIPTRALIRSVSVHVRDSLQNMDFALMQVVQLRRDNTIPQTTTSIMNVLMSAAAERGDIDRVLSLLKDFERYNILLDANTISFGLESLGKNLLRRRKYNQSFIDRSNPKTRDHIDACMVVANVLLNHIEDYQIKTNDHIIRNYIEFLCLAGHVDTATTILLEAVQEQGLVSSKSIYRVAMANAKLFQFDIARQIATCDRTAEPVQFLLQAIDREEHLFNVAMKQQQWEQQEQDLQQEGQELEQQHENQPFSSLASSSEDDDHNDVERLFGTYGDDGTDSNEQHNHYVNNNNVNDHDGHDTNYNNNDNDSNNRMTYHDHPVHLDNSTFNSYDESANDTMIDNSAVSSTNKSSSLQYHHHHHEQQQQQQQQQQLPDEPILSIRSIKEIMQNQKKEKDYTDTASFWKKSTVSSSNIDSSNSRSGSNNKNDANHVLPVVVDALTYDDIEPNIITTPINDDDNDKYNK